MRKPWQDSEYTEERDRPDRDRAAVTIEQRAREAHGGQRSDPDQEQGETKLSVRHPGTLLDCGHARAPRPPEGAKGREAHNDPYPARHSPRRYRGESS